MTSSWHNKDNIPWHKSRAASCVPARSLQYPDPARGPCPDCLSEDLGNSGTGYRQLPSLKGSRNGGTRSEKDVIKTQWTHDAMITTLLRQNDVATSFWRNNDVIIASHVRWGAMAVIWKKNTAGVLLERANWYETFYNGLWKYNAEWVTQREERSMGIIYLEVILHFKRHWNLPSGCQSLVIKISESFVQRALVLNKMMSWNLNLFRINGALWIYRLTVDPINKGQ